MLVYGVSAVIQCKLSCPSIVKESYECFLFKCYTTELIKEEVCVCACVFALGLCGYVFVYLLLIMLA